jgi:hypothetical protein
MTCPCCNSKTNSFRSEILPAGDSYWCSVCNFIGVEDYFTRGTTASPEEIDFSDRNYADLRKGLKEGTVAKDDETFCLVCQETIPFTADRKKCSGCGQTHCIDCECDCHVPQKGCN